MHRLEAIHVGARYEYTRTLIEEMEAWLRVNGVPPDELVAMSEGSLLMVARVGKRQPDTVLEGGELLAWSPYHFEVVWTPGHSAGLICLYEPQAQVLVSSDHVLECISPHIGLHTQSFGNPLGDYLSSLQLVRDLPVKTILPGHGAPFHDLPGRVDALGYGLVGGIWTANWGCPPARQEKILTAGDGSLQEQVDNLGGLLEGVAGWHQGGIEAVQVAAGGHGRRVPDEIAARGRWDVAALQRT